MLKRMAVITALSLVLSGIGTTYAKSPSLEDLNLARGSSVTDPNLLDLSHYWIVCVAGYCYRIPAPHGGH